MLTFFKDKHVVVLGLARSGEAAAILLSKLGASVLISDQKSDEELKDNVARLVDECPDVRFHLGGHPDEILDNADLVVISPGVPSGIPVLETARKRDIPVIGEVELAYRVCRSPIIAITGTKGKSTTSTLLGQILNKEIELSHESPTDTFSIGGRIIVAGNIGTPISKYVLDLTEADLLVLEISSFQLETTVNFRPAVSVILNIMQDHIDRHSSIEDYINAKYRIFANQTEDDYTVLNAEDPLSFACVSRTRAKVVLFSSKGNLDAGVYLENGKIIANSGTGDPVTICDRSDIRIPGRHNLENALAATAVSMIYGVRPDAVKEVLKNFPGLEHALELAGEIDGIRFINDSKATNVISLQAALESLSGNIILIIGGRDKGNDYIPLIPVIKKVKHLIIIGESADKIQNSIGSFTRSHRATTMDDAVNLAYSLAKSGDTILLSPACASFDMFKDYAERGRSFKEAVKRIVG